MASSDNNNNRIRNITADSNNVETARVPVRKPQADVDPDMDLDFDFSFRKDETDSIAENTDQSAAGTGMSDTISFSETAASAWLDEFDRATIEMSPIETHIPADSEDPEIEEPVESADLQFDEPNVKAEAIDNSNVVIDKYQFESPENNDDEFDFIYSSQGVVARTENAESPVPDYSEAGDEDDSTFDNTDDSELENTAETFAENNDDSAADNWDFEEPEFNEISDVIESDEIFETPDTVESPNAAMNSDAAETQIEINDEGSDNKEKISSETETANGDSKDDSAAEKSRGLIATGMIKKDPLQAKLYGLHTGQTIATPDGEAGEELRRELAKYGLSKEDARDAAYGSDSKEAELTGFAALGHKIRSFFRKNKDSEEDLVASGDVQTIDVIIHDENKDMAKSTGGSSGGKGSGSGYKSNNKQSGGKSAGKNAAKASSKSSAGKSSGKGKSSGGGSKGYGKQPPKKRSGLVRFARAFCITIITCGLLGCIAGGAYGAYVISHAEPIHPDRIYDTLDVSSHIYDDKENLVDEIYFSENRQISTYEELPDNLKNAFIAVEDKTFWSHRGFNFRRIIGAILERFKGGRISGTSTITQQLARNVFLPEEKSDRNLRRKITEMYYAYEIEEELSKEEILTAYLNTIYLGYGCYGVDTAARTYFGCSVEDLSLEQCAALAALPQAPGAYSLLVTEEGEYTTKLKKDLYANDASESRRNMILGLMQDQGYITSEEREEATKPLADFINPGSASVASKSAFKDYLIETITHDLMEQYDLTEEQATKIIYTKGLNIYSTMDSQAQKAITKQFKNKDNFPGTVKKSKGVQAAMVITKIGTGEIKAMVGSRSASGQMLFNRATNPRQPGSSIKPLTVYAAALQKSYEFQKNGDRFKFVNTGYDKQGTKDWGNYITVSSTVIDEPMTVNGQTWPLNVTRSYSGKNTFKTAIQKSINTCAVKILAQVGISYAMDTLESFGITTAIADSSESHNDLNLAALGLGAMTEGVTPLEMALAYAAFPNGGVVNSPICYTRVDDANGRTLLEAKSETTKVLNPGVAWIMTEVLKSNVTSGIARAAAVSGIQVGGKTGTTDDRYDIWFDGFTANYSAALWIGTDDNVAMDQSSETAAALWSKVMSNVKRAKKGEYKSRPDNVVYGWDGNYYTRGTVPPEPEPEEEEEDKDAKDGKDKAKGGEKTESKDSGSKKTDN